MRSFAAKAILARMSGRILFVEDEPGVVLVVSDLLRAEGHTVATAKDGKIGLRRAPEESFDLLILEMMLEFGGVTADFSRMEFSRNGRPRDLAATEAELLRLLITHRSQLLPREKLLKQIWKEQPFITPRTVDVHITWLRQPLEDDPQSPKHILTVHGEGYRFER